MSRQAQGPDPNMTDKTPDREALWNAPWKVYGNPVDLVDDARLDYEFRLRLLQHWLSQIAEGRADRADRADVEAAIFALEARAQLKADEPEGTPKVHTYGVVDPSDLRRYSVSAIAKRIRRFLRNP
jgi:hypothetical protein